MKKLQVIYFKIFKGLSIRIRIKYNETDMFETACCDISNKQ